MSTNDIEIITYILGQNSPNPFAIQLRQNILKACRQILQDNPEPVKAIIREAIQKRQNSDSLTQPQESLCEPSKISSVQISSTPRNTSRSPDAGTPSSIYAIPTTATETCSADHASSSLSVVPQSSTTSTPVKTTFPFSRKEVESWAGSSKQFLSPKKIDADKLDVCEYIQKLEATERSNTFRLRFALRQLWFSRELWRPRTRADFLTKLKIKDTSTFDIWMKEGRIYYLLTLHHGVQVLFAALKTRPQLRKLRIPRQKKRPVAELLPNHNTKADIEATHGDEAKGLSSLFLARELQLPEKFDGADETDENCDSADTLFKAAENIVASLEELHREKILYTVDGAHTDKLDALSNSQNERLAKRACHSQDSHDYYDTGTQADTMRTHNLLDASQDSQSATDSCQSRDCSGPATNDDAMVNTGQPLQPSPAERATDSIISNYEYGCTSTNFSTLPDKQAATQDLQEHTMAEDPPFPCSPILPNSLHDQTKRFQSQQRAELSSSERTTTSWSATGLPSPSLVEPGQEGASSDIRDAYDRQSGSTPNIRFSPTSLTSTQFRPPSSQPASGPRVDTSDLHSHGTVTASALTSPETPFSAPGQTTSTMQSASIGSTNFDSFGSSEHIPQSEDSRLSELFLPNCDHALESTTSSTFDAQATNYPGETSPKVFSIYDELLRDGSWDMWNF
ncbi:hypothetical protein FOPG_16811 [Fusarium oxysporum f. sp. conglutinans race 2 54008]|uniref:Uncharacterized protein n=2 Tax=Fusarium oxysporum f. sp. conglutinans TaxID=100902 RepID=F9F5K9_FUSOF|nr:hypothetical protein FOXB_01684 [Fusarium oxysporum f. sp. conglutinans Fo5176]EXL67040.1 hypothetical protein FOPG_16811 [Fusarium oxysporum f. sp. conglutinans race 2 54008]KAG6989987.1 hypothetical protein FocnCong_v020163 [Fusarium oxysporum f. sp. conglutinans]KAI8416412.1 hypothetical protein FOFC_02722 [Fusarium oxysporum]